MAGLELPRTLDGWLDPSAYSSDGTGGRVVDGQYQAGPDRVTLPTTPPASILGGLPKPLDWAPERSSLNVLMTPQQIADIDFTDGQSARPVPAQPAGGGFFTGLHPYAPDPKGPIHAGINQNGYVPQPGDDNQLARLIMAEGASTPQDRAALGWAAVNRVGNREFGQSLDQVVNKKNAFQSVQENKGLWPQSANPETFTGPNAKAWQQSQATAHGIFSGAIPDPTGGATLFFSSNGYNPASTKTAPPTFQKMLSHTDIVPSLSYPSTPDRTAGMRNYFFVENPYRK